MAKTNTANYWENRYHEQNTPWDMGQVSPPLSGFMQQRNDRQQRILIPGAGNAYEAEWLWRNGFTNCEVVEVAPAPLKNLQQRVADFPDAQLHLKDFFELEGHYDLILEQTFFCALPPAERERYVKKMAQLLPSGASLVGLLFNFPLTTEGPPYGGDIKEYRERFSPYFKLHRLESCYNSISPRQGKELFIHFIRK